VRLILAFALSLSLIGCSFGKDSSGNSNKRELEEQQQADADYKQVVGTYAGKFIGSTKYDIELRFFTLQIPNGTNSDGRTKFRTELRANYKKINPVAPGYTFQAQYYPETGRLVLTNMEKEENLGMDDIHTIELALVRKTLNDGTYIRQLQGEGKGARGPLGYFQDLNLVTQQNDKPDQNEEDEYNERLRAQFKEIEGNYVGTVMQDPRVGPPLAVILRLYIQNDAGNSKRPPILRGLFTQDDGGDIQFDIQTVYKPELQPPRLTMLGTVLRAPNSNLRLTADGVFKDVQVKNPVSGKTEIRKAITGQLQYSSLYLDGEFTVIREK
jgi:hypothetical protein